MMKTTLILVRHGETLWNREKRWQGQGDSNLTAAGLSQARHVAERLSLEKVETLYSSDSGRAFQTASIIGQRLGLGVIKEPALRECDVGSWEGLNTPEIEERFPQDYAAWLNDRTLPRGGGESFEQLTRRGTGVIKNIFEANPGRTVVAVSHGGTIQSVAAQVLGIPPAQARNLRGMENCGLAWLVQDEDGVIRLQRYNVPAFGVELPEELQKETGEAL